MLLNLHLGNRFATKLEYRGTNSLFQKFYNELHSSRSHPVSSVIKDRWSTLRMIRKFQKHDIMFISLKIFLFGLASEKHSLCPPHSFFLWRILIKIMSGKAFALSLIRRICLLLIYWLYFTIFRS